MGWGSLSNKCQIVCQMSKKSVWQWMGFTRKEIRHNENQTWRSNLRWYMRIIGIAKTHSLWNIWGFLMPITCDVKIDLIEPHYVKLFLWTSSFVQLFNLQAKNRNLLFHERKKIFISISKYCHIFFISPYFCMK